MGDWFVYILQCRDKTFYTGVTTDIGRRLHEHNETSLGAKYTRSRRPVKLVYLVDCNSRSDATRLEYKVRKLSRLDKINLIENYSREPGH
ncbi:MAG: GIY-YIG nuclease family protein [Gammaproteobacteria bacterium]|nr:GIY-YIG nuclease family protein [Gammaproteobacteria bacterium]